MGLTGGIGAGKSAVAAHLTALGAVVIDSDVLAREVVAPGTDGLTEIRARFGDDVISSDGALDRAALAARVFDDPAARADLEAITHPRVRARADALAAFAPADAIVVNDIPLLAEVGLAPRFHLVAVVESPFGTRLDRLAARGTAPPAAKARMAAQMSDAERRRVADVVLDNSGTLDALHSAVDVLWRERLVPYERNLRTATVARRPERLRLVPYDPTWPQRYERIAARLRYALGDAASAVSHIGSTSVPGLAAKNVIDIQVAVADLDDVAGVEPRLAAAGFIRREGMWADTPKSFAPDPADWRKFLFGGADPADVVHIHVRAHGSPGWRYALMFRDWLRAEPDAVRAYADEKMRLAGLHTTTSGYVEAKEPWFDVALPRVEAWAARTGWTPGD